MRGVVNADLARAPAIACCRARSLGEAREVWSRHRDEIALLLTDLVLPDGYGSELALALITERPELPALCMSGYADDRWKSANLMTRLAHIAKPFSSEELLQRVGQLIGTGRGARRRARCRRDKRDSDSELRRAYSIGKKYRAHPRGTSSTINDNVNQYK